MDNFNVDITSKGREHFDAAVRLAKSSHDAAAAMCVHPVHGLVFFWMGPTLGAVDTFDGHRIDALAFPVKGAEALANLAWEWLTAVVDYGQEPDLDGSVSKGFRVRSRVRTDKYCAASHRVLFAVEPVWALLGK